MAAGLSEQLLQALLASQLEQRKNILTNDNYETWSLKAEAEMTEGKCWEAISPGYAAIQDADLTEEQKSKNQSARAYLFNHVSVDILTDIRSQPRAKAMWDALQRLHGRMTAIHMAMLLKELGRFEKTEEMSMHHYIAKIQTFCDKLALGGVNFTTHMVSVFLISCLPLDKYGSLVRSMRMDRNLDIQDVKGKLFLEERSMKLQPVSTVTQEPKVETANALPAQSSNATRGKGRWKSNNKQSGVRCFKCKEIGHVIRDCPKNKDGQSQTGSNGSKHISAICTVAGVSAASSAQEDVWFLDSGASDPMTPQRERFTEFQPYCGTVKIGKGVLTVEGKGKVEVRMSEKCGGFSMTLSDCLFVPELEMNLISVKKLATKGVNTLCTNECAIGMRASDSLEVFRAYPTGDVYALEMEPRSAVAAWCKIGPLCHGEADATALRARAEPWHERLGHLHEAAMKKLPGLEDSKIKNPVCDVCVQGKISKVSDRPGSVLDLCADWASQLNLLNHFTDWISLCFLKTVVECTGLGAQ